VRERAPEEDEALDVFFGRRDLRRFTDPFLAHGEFE